MPINDWTNAQIKNLIAYYEREKRTEGGPFSKAQAMLNWSGAKGVNLMAEMSRD
jgi:hypothetical protein